DVIGAVTKSWAGLAGLLLLFLLIAQFIAYFNFSKMPEVAAAWLGDTIENSGVGGVWLLLAAIAITAVVNLIIPQAIAKWALLAPIFIPLFLRLGVGPATVLAAYRVGDSPGNILTPIMAYFPLIVVFASRYDKRSGIGTVIALMLPFFIALTIVWTLFFVVWYLIGIPFGLGT
ncbi:MAG: AbgT family transporter, partial [Streptosporangiaceae bacterium]|nr:AbgT family transporter [Streptosporangiaceae bacterium]